MRQTPKIDDFPPHIQEQIRAKLGQPPKTTAQQIEENPEPVDRMNKTERRFYNQIIIPHIESGKIALCRFEEIKFRLADRTWYTPDFYIEYNPEADSEFPGINRTIIEVKGFWRDDAAVKFKTAAELYPEYNWLAATWEPGGWVIKRQKKKKGL